MKLYRLILIIGLITVFFSCKEDEQKIDISDIAIDYSFDKFHQDFHDATPANFSKLRNKYPRFLDQKQSDSIWLSYAKDSLWLALHHEIDSNFGTFKKENEAITSIFKYVKYYYPSFKAPRVVTYNAGLMNLENPIIYSDSTLIISVDSYLGASNKFYSNFPVYLRKSFEKNQISIQVARSVAKQTQPKVLHREFIAKMIAAGQLQYAVSQFIPSVSEKDLFRYDDKKMQWIQDNEEDIWKYFMEKEYIYSTDKDLSRRFLEPAPFTKFYMTFDNESPGRVGAWIGYKIVQSYMKKNAVSLPDMMATAPSEIFKKSKYKPNR